MAEALPERSAEPRMRARSRVLAILAAFVVGLAVRPAAQETGREYDVKASFVFNFARFVVWPATAFSSPGAPIVLCLIGGDPFDGALDRIVAGRLVNGLPLEVSRRSTGDRLPGCHIVFVSRDSERDVERVLTALVGVPALVVGDMDGFARRGGTVNLFLDNRRVRFEINVEAAGRHGLRLSSKLLALARIVDDVPGR